MAAQTARTYAASTCRSADDAIRRLPKGQSIIRGAFGISRWSSLKQASWISIATLNPLSRDLNPLGFDKAGLRPSKIGPSNAPRMKHAIIP
jgi:hypothetical protein